MTRRMLGARHHEEDTVGPNTDTVANSGFTELVEATEVNGQTGFFAVDNTGGDNTIVVFPQVSYDGTTWFEMDNGTGESMTTSHKKIFPFLGRYKYVKLVASAVTEDIGVVSALYVSSI